MFAGIHHTSISTGDAARLCAFYQEHFGFSRVHEAEWDGGAPAADAIYGLNDTSVHMVMLRLGLTFLEIFEFRRPKRERADDRAVAVPGYTHIAVTTDDIEADYKRLLAAGVPFHCPPMNAVGLCRATYARDPDGNIVELLQPEPRGSFDVGGYVAAG